MDSDSDSSFEFEDSLPSACPVCRGIGDLKNPRGVSVKLPDRNERHKRYAYVYMHHPSIRVLCKYSKACKMCRLLRKELKAHVPVGFDKFAAAYSPPPRATETRPESTTHATEPDDDYESIATDLQELRKPHNLRMLDFKHFRSRRVVLRCFFDDDAGPRGSINRFDVEVLALGYCHLGKIRGFIHPCKSIVTS